MTCVEINDCTSIYKKKMKALHTLLFQYHVKSRIQIYFHKTNVIQNRNNRNNGYSLWGFDLFGGLFHHKAAVGQYGANDEEVKERMDVDIDGRPSERREGTEQPHGRGGRKSEYILPPADDDEHLIKQNTTKLISLISN